MYTRKFLKQWWRKALRRRILFSAIDKEDRGYLYLTIKAFDEVRSMDVGRIIVKILAKLKAALKSPFAKKMETYGLEKARTISKIAIEWGHSTAGSWIYETGFVRYLTVLYVYQP